MILLSLFHSVPRSVEERLRHIRPGVCVHIFSAIRIDGVSITGKKAIEVAVDFLGKYPHCAAVHLENVLSAENEYEYLEWRLDEYCWKVIEIVNSFHYMDLAELWGYPPQKSKN